MKKYTLFSAILIGIGILAAPASAQFLGQMTPASIIPASTGKLGAQISAAEDAFAVVGSFRYGFYTDVEGRVRLGFIDQDGSNTDPHLIASFDVKYQLWKYGQYNNPFDFAISGFLEHAVLEYGKLTGYGGAVIGSIPFTLKNNSVIEPYARLSLRAETLSSRVSDDSETDFQVGGNFGAMFRVTPLVDITAEFQIDEQTAFLVGIDFVSF
jgi:hypothetical protein